VSVEVEHLFLDSVTLSNAIYVLYRRAYFMAHSSNLMTSSHGFLLVIVVRASQLKPKHPSDPTNSTPSPPSSTPP
jgi:hypothetical protein